MDSTPRFPSQTRLFLIGLLAIAWHPASSQSASPPDPGMTALLADFRTLRPASDGISFQDRSLRIGHLELYSKQGSLFALKTARGESLGWYYTGDGRLLYRSENPADRQALEVNLARESASPSYQNGTVMDGFKRLLILAPSFSLQDLAEKEAATTGGSPAPPSPRALDAADRAAFEQMWSGLQRTSLPLDHRAAEARLNPGTRGYFLVEAAGGRKPLGYEYDGIREGAECLFLLEYHADIKIRLQKQLSRQSLEGDSRRGASLALKDLQVSLRTEDNRTAAIASDLTCQVEGGALKVARLALLNNRNAQAADWTSTRNQLRVRQVTDETGRSLAFSHRHHEILVELPRTYTDQEFVNLRFQTEGEILLGMGFQTDGEIIAGMGHGQGNNYFELLHEPWFPQQDVWHRSGFTYTLTMRTRKPFRPVATGSTISFKEDGDFYELVSESARPARMLAALAGKYVTGEAKLGQLTVRVHAYAMARRQTLEVMPKLAADLVRFYEQALGPYHSTRLEIVEVPYFTESGIAFGIATPGLVLMTSEAYQARGQWENEYFSRGVNARLAHEIAHQWFGVAAAPARGEDIWLAESAAEYMAALAMGTSQAEEKGIVGFRQMFTEWRSTAKECRDSGSLATAWDLAGERGGIDRACLLYNRGPLVLHMLRTMAGNDAFFATLRRYLEKARADGASTACFQAAAEEVLQQDLEWFFDSWYRQGGIPEIQVQERTVSESGKPVLVVRAVQGNGPGFKRILIPFLVDYGGDRREVKLLLQDKPVTEARFVLDSQPRSVQVDPAQNNLAVYRQIP